MRIFSFFWRSILIILGLLLLAVFIWFAGPYFAFAGYAPLEPELARVIVIVLVVGLWLVSRLLRRLRAYRLSDRLVSAVVQQSAAEPSRSSAEATQLRERFEEAVATLKKGRRSGHSLYDLPWYVIIGAPGSGKTTALLNSGLKFPLEQRHGKGALRGVGGTRNCDWWFTDEAVFLDTAGRYTTQDSDASSDSAAWGEFLTLLRKYRTRRPVNGVILTISAQDLMVQGDRGRENHVEAARRRLTELNQQLKIQLPVYVMVTKCDLVSGFTEYFDDLTQETRAQVWGVTFPYEQTLKGEAAQGFTAEFDALMARLNERVFARVEEDRDARRRAKLFAFPQQMAALRDALAQFVTEVFAATSFDQQVLLRGVYLTSGTQEGTPIDRLLGAIGRRFGVAQDAVVAPTGRGKAYFVERLLKEVLIGESGLAGVNRRLEMKKAAMQLGAYAAMAVLAVVGVILLSVSYGRNSTYINATSTELAKLKETPQQPRTATVEALLPRLDALRAIADTANQYTDDPPLGMRWGLFQGYSLGNAARDAYVRELDNAMLPRVAARMEQRIGQYASEPEKLFEYLKAYMMLGEPRYLDKKHLQMVADLEWHAADTADPDAGPRLSKHFQALLEYGESLRPIAVNPARIAQAQSTIRQASIAQIIYGRMKRGYGEDAARAVRLDLAGGVGTETVIRRRSGANLSTPVSSFFSRPVFQEVTGRDMDKLVKQFAADDWVWGDAGRIARNPGRLGSDVTDLYERDYIAAWEGVLSDLELIPFPTAAQAVTALGILSGPTSPLRGVLAAIAEHTTFVASPEGDKDKTKPGLAERAAEAARKKIDDGLSGLFGSKPGAKPAVMPGALITAHFQPLHRMMEGEPGSAPIDRVLLRLGQVQLQLRTLARDGGSAAPLDNPALTDLLQALQQDAELLPPVVQSLVGQIGRRAEVSAISGATRDIEKLYRQDVLRECTELVAGRYPFAVTSTTDVQLKDFVRVFGYGGAYDTFFKENLERLVDRSLEPWGWRSGAVPASRAMLDKFQAAQELRELFFNRTSGEFGVRFAVTVTEVDTGTARFTLEIDGNPFEYRIPALRLLGKWPNLPNPGQTALTFLDSGGGKNRAHIPGPWAWFHLIDDAQDSRQSDVRFELLTRLDRHHARIVIEPTSVINPFTNRSWQRFTCDM